MEILHPTAELFPPNACALCDETPKPSEQRVIDTGFNTIVPFTDVVGRKYVCEKCGLEIANRLGFVSNKQAKAAFHAAELAAKQLALVKERIVVAAQDIVDFTKDASVSSERAAVSKWVEGDFVESSDAIPQEVPAKKAGRPRASAKSDSSAPSK